MKVEEKHAGAETKAFPVKLLPFGNQPRSNDYQWPSVGIGWSKQK